MKVCLVRYSEIALKGKNITSFENLLVRNIKEGLIKNKTEFNKLIKTYKKILIYTDNDCDFLKKVFGVASFSHTVECDLDINKIKKTVLDLTKKIKFKKFRISARRANKNFGYDSVQINIDVGDLIRKKLNKKVDLKHFDLDVGIDILDKAYVFIDKIKGPGGLPLGIEGNVVVLIEDRNSLLASYLVMKRGCKIIPVAYKKFDTSLFKKFDYGLKLKIVRNIKEIEKIVKEKNAKALVLGQTLNNIKKIKIKLIVLRPLIGLSEEEIKVKLNYLEKNQ